MNDKLVEKCLLTPQRIEAIIDGWNNIDNACMAEGTDRPDVADLCHDVSRMTVVETCSIIAEEIKNMRLPNTTLCDCGHPKTTHYNNEGCCDVCGCTWYYPNIGVIDTFKAIRHLFKPVLEKGEKGENHL